jgi:hypothetical protein
VFNILRKFQDVISTIEVIKHEIEENQIRTNLKLELTDSSQLIIKDYKFSDNKRKYVYHWMDRDGNLRIRWDNTEQNNFFINSVAISVLKTTQI